MTMRIGFVPHPEFGHLFPTLRLAGDLARRGHQISYIVPPAYADLIQKHGFLSIPIWQDWFDSGFVRTRGVGPAQERMHAWRRFIAAKVELTTGGTLQRLLRGGRFDLIVSDTMTFGAAVIAWSLGIPCVQYATQLPADVAVPGVGHDKRLLQSIARKAAVDVSAYESFPELNGYLERLEARYGYSGADIVRPSWLPGFSCKTAMGPMLLVPPALAVDPVIGERFTYCQSLPRPRAGDWHPRATTSKRVILAFGSNSATYPAAPHVARAMFAAFAEWPDMQLVAAGLPRAFAEGFTECRNIEFCDFIPQRELLRDGTRLMCSHGGMGTFKECVYHGTPLFLTPMSYDQPLNGTFVEALGIGTSVTPDSPAEAIRLALHRTLGNRDQVERVAELGRAVRAFENLETGADFVETALHS